MKFWKEVEITCRQDLQIDLNLASGVTDLDRQREKEGPWEVGSGRLYRVAVANLEI